MVDMLIKYRHRHCIKENRFIHAQFSFFMLSWLRRRVSFLGARKYWSNGKESKDPYSVPLVISLQPFWIHYKLIKVMLLYQRKISYKIEFPNYGLARSITFIWSPKVFEYEFWWTHFKSTYIPTLYFLHWRVMKVALRYF